ncbi:MAG: cytochrome c oxidase subunit 3 [Maricaulaceae bacterium]
MAGAAKHDYHLVEPSPWPLVASVGVFVLALGAVIFMKGLVTDETAASFFLLGEGQPWVMLAGFGLVVYTMVGWWGDVAREGKQGDHTPVVDIGLRYGMILFIASEVMFFVAWFWVFFELALFHDVRLLEGWESWPPPGIETFDPLHLPLLNTMILLTSGMTVTYAHHYLIEGKRQLAKNWLIATVILGASFSCVQVYEYAHAHFDFSGNLYGASFFMATGFHGFHVLVGTIFLLVCYLLMKRDYFKPEKHFGFEAAAWYWHFVDVVWLFLFAFVYFVFN